MSISDQDRSALYADFEARVFARLREGVVRHRRAFPCDEDAKLDCADMLAIFAAPPQAEQAKPAQNAIDDLHQLLGLESSEDPGNRAFMVRCEVERLLARRAEQAKPEHPEWIGAARRALKACLEMYDKHDEWCGNNENAPGNSIHLESPRLAREALELMPKAEMANSEQAKPPEQPAGSVDDRVAAKLIEYSFSGRSDRAEIVICGCKFTRTQPTARIEVDAIAKGIAAEVDAALAAQMERIESAVPAGFYIHNTGAEGRMIDRDQFVARLRAAASEGKK